ncbi:MAG: hypothetical protein QOE92_1411 [Chloroflexota bacterium]|jgi:hypothetical protein|nr:hypothetical protein [Chloroflexota bacterium]
MSLKAIKKAALAPRSIVVGAVTAGMLLAVGIAAFAAIPDSSGTIHGCRANSGGALRVVDDSSTCTGSETAMAWQVGPTVHRTTITTQPSLPGSNGSTWTDISPVLQLTITPDFNCFAIINGSADLWTDAAGYNQDIGISVTGGAFPGVVGQPEAWKESGGAATFSPNASFVTVTRLLQQGTAYTIKLQWKSNKSAPSSARIYAGAGPISGHFSPTSLTALCAVPRS